MDTTASFARPVTRPVTAGTGRPVATRVSERHATNSVLVDLVAHLVIAFAIGLAASLALAGAVLLLSDGAPGSQANSYSVPATSSPITPASSN